MCSLNHVICAAACPLFNTSRIRSPLPAAAPDVVDGCYVCFAAVVMCTHIKMQVVNLKEQPRPAADGCMPARLLYCTCHSQLRVALSFRKGRWSDAGKIGLVRQPIDVCLPLCCAAHISNIHTLLSDGREVALSQWFLVKRDQAKNEPTLSWF